MESSLFAKALSKFSHDMAYSQLHLRLLYIGIVFSLNLYLIPGREGCGEITFSSFLHSIRKNKCKYFDELCLFYTL